MDRNLEGKSPSISVIMGVYNVATLPVFLSSIHSILHQTFPDFEFIICDDGSTDTTPDILRRIARSDRRIRLITNDVNLGLAASLNRCIGISRGHFIARQDADDISDLERFEKQIAFLEMNKSIGFLGTNVRLFDASGIWGERILEKCPTKYDFLFTAPFVHGSIMFRKETLEKVRGYRVAKETRRTEDYDLEMRLYAQGVAGENLQEFLYDYCEDKETGKRRKYKYRIDEMKVRWKGFKKLSLFPMAIPYVIKPIIVGFIPRRFLVTLKRGKTMRFTEEWRK